MLALDGRLLSCLQRGRRSVGCRPGSLDCTRSQPAVGDGEVVLPTRLVEQEQRAGVDHPQEVRACDLPQGRWTIDQHEDGRRGTEVEAGRSILEGQCLGLLLRLCDSEVGL